MAPEGLQGGPEAEEQDEISFPAAHSITSEMCTANENPVYVNPGEGEVNLGEGSAERKRANENDSGQEERPAVQRKVDHENHEAEPQRPKARDVKRVGKAASLAPIVGLTNDMGMTEKPKSAREIIRLTRPDISMLDLLAWSPS